MFREVGPIINSNTQKAVAIIQGIRMIRLKIKTKHSLANSLEFVTHYSTILKQAKNDQKPILIDVLVGIFRFVFGPYFLIFRNLLETTMQSEGKSSVSYTEWNALIKSFYEMVDRKKISGKKKDMLVVYLILFISPIGARSTSYCFSLPL